MQEQINTESGNTAGTAENISWIDKIEFMVTTKWFMLFLIVGGIIFYIITKNVLNPQVQQSAQAMAPGLNTPEGGYKIFLEIVNLLCGTAISTGVLSLFLRITSMKKIITDVVTATYNDLSRNILNADFNLGAYSMDMLEELQERIVVRKSGTTVKPCELKYSVYSVEKRLSNLLVGIYYEYHKATYWISPNSNSKTFKKTVELEYKTVNNYQLDNSITLNLEFMDVGNQSDEEKKKKVRFTEFLINDIDLLREVPKLITIENISDDPNEYYDYRLIFKRELKENTSHTVKIKYEYDVPLWDSTQSFVLIYPCEFFEHKIFIDNKFDRECMDYSKWKLRVNGFSSFHYPHSDAEQKFNVQAQTDRNAEITFFGWVLPGTGYVIYFTEPENEIH